MSHSTLKSDNPELELPLGDSEQSKNLPEMSQPVEECLVDVGPLVNGEPYDPAKHGSFCLIQLPYAFDMEAMKYIPNPLYQLKESAK